MSPYCYNMRLSLCVGVFIHSSSTRTRYAFMGMVIITLCRGNESILISVFLILVDSSNHHHITDWGGNSRDGRYRKQNHMSQVKHLTIISCLCSVWGNYSENLKNLNNSVSGLVILAPVHGRYPSLIESYTGGELIVFLGSAVAQAVLATPTDKETYQVKICAAKEIKLSLWWVNSVRFIAQHPEILTSLHIPRMQ